MQAQLPKIALPLIPQVSQSVFVSPLGDDANPGSYDLPLKTFGAAINKIDFGTANIDGGHHYAEIVLKSGDYYPKGNNSLAQYDNQWRKKIGNDYVYKDLSIRGIGNVNIHGDSMDIGVQMIFLQGEGISVRNIKIFNAPLHGIFCYGSAIKPHQNIIIDSVVVDGSDGFGILFIGYDKILVKNSTVANTCKANEFEKNMTCQWASGLRADNCSNVTFHDNKVYRNWGEGLNTSLSKYINVYDNVIYDNYSVNLYVHSAANAIYSHNLIYNSDSTYWRYCYNSKGYSGGLSIANELTCTDACFFWTNNCGTNFSCCSYTDVDHPIITQVNYKQVDSIFVFNNIMLGNNITIWDSFSGFLNYGYINNVFITNNTVIDHQGAAQAGKSPISIAFGTPFLYFKNLHISQNIISIDTKLPNAYIFKIGVNETCNGNWKSEVKLNDNLWSTLPSYPGLDFSQDKESATLPYSNPINELDKLIPSKLNSAFVLKSSLPDFITDDYFHNTRNTLTNSGAIEYMQTNASNNFNETAEQIKLSPNPVSTLLHVQANFKIKTCTVYSQNGVMLFNTNQSELNCNNLANGWYYLQIMDTTGKVHFRSFIVNKL